MKSKADYRHYFVECKQYIKLSAILKEHGQSHTNLSMFMKDEAYDHYLSLEMCKQIQEWIEEAIANVT